MINKPTGSKNLLIIGDVHGRYNLLTKLIKLSKQSGEVIDQIVLVGDLIDRGSQNKKVIDFVAKSKDVVSLMGNHDHSFILNFLKVNPISSYTAEGDWSTETQVFETVELKKPWQIPMNGGAMTVKELKNYKNMKQYAQKMYDKQLLEYEVDNILVTHAPLRKRLDDLVSVLDVEKYLWHTGAPMAQSDKLLVYGHTGDVAVWNNVKGEMVREDLHVFPSNGTFEVGQAINVDKHTRGLAGLLINSKSLEFRFFEIEDQTGYDKFRKLAMTGEINRY